MREWSGRAVAEARAVLADLTEWPTTCARCPRVLKRTDRWVCGHKLSRVSHPELTWEISNWQVECRPCSDASAQSAVIEKAKRDALIEAGFSPSTTPQQPPPLPVSLSGDRGWPTAIREDLLWSPETLSEFDWLQPLLEVPDDASPPLAMTPPHPRAVGSYGWDAIAWIEEQRGLRLRWWQKWAIVRQLEHDADGRLVWRYVVESAPRRAGKSERLRSLALWRMEHGNRLFEPDQIVVHIARDLGIAREVQERAWPWCESREWDVTRGNGKEKVQHPNGARWMVKAKDAVYGFDGHAVIADECWDLAPSAISDGAEPAMRHRVSPQLVMTSTSHPKATSLMPSKIAGALADDDGRTLLLLWAAAPGSDPSSPDTWRAASPYWEDEDEELMAAGYAEAIAKEPTVDDPEPLVSWVAQYLNVWRLTKRRQVKGTAMVSGDVWSSRAVAPIATVPAAAAIEAWFEQGVSLALSWKLDDGTVVVGSSDHGDLAQAAAALKATGYRGRTIVGASLMTDPALRSVSRIKGEGRTLAAVQVLERLLSEGGVRHDGGQHLTDQVLAVRTMPGVDGPRLVSTERSDALKAAVWAATAARAPGLGRPRVLVARS